MGTYSSADQVNDLRTQVSDIELGGDDSRFAIEFAESPDYSAHEISFVELMAFHIGIDAGHIEDITDSDGCLNKSAQDRLIRYLRGLFVDRYSSIARLDLQFADYNVHDDEPSFAVSLFVPVSDTKGMTLGEFIEKYYAPFQGALINVCDPGTFNHPYLFSHV